MVSKNINQRVLHAKMKPLVSPHDIAISAANAPSQSSDGSHEEAAPKAKKPRASRATTKKAADGEAKPKPKTKSKSSKAAAVEAPPPPEFGFFRCMCCDYSVNVLPGTEKPAGGLRCPSDFTRLHWVHS